MRAVSYGVADRFPLRRFASRSIPVRKNVNFSRFPSGTDVALVAGVTEIGDGRRSGEIINR
jgi:hypothetical protein